MTWDKLIAGYLAHLRAARKSSETITLRRLQLQRIAHDLAGTPPGRVTTEDLAAWLGEREWAKATARSHRAALRGVFGWAVEAGKLRADPARRLPPVGVTPPAPRPTPEAMLRAALAKAGPRERLMVRLGAEIGLRRGEICRVHVRDLESDLLGESLRVHGKGDRVRLVPVTSSLARAIRDAGEAGGGWCFPGQIDGHLSAPYVGKVMSRLFPVGWTAHKLRHRFASAAYAVDHDLVTVQQLLGHASLATTQAYVAAPSAAKRRLVEAVAA